MLLLISNRRLDDVKSGSGAYLVTFIKSAILAGYDVRLVMSPSTAFGSRPWATLDKPILDRVTPEWPSSVRLGSTFVSTKPLVWFRFAQRLILETARRLKLTRAKPVSLLSRIPSASEQAELAAVVRRHAPACVVVEYSSFAPAFAHMSQVPGRGVLMHDLFSSRADSFRAAGKKPDHGDITLAQEAQRLASANLVLHASMNELQRLSPLAPGARHVWMRPTTTARRDAQQSRAPAALFMGAGHEGNREGLNHLLTDIWPLVRARLPDAKLVVAGTIGDGLASENGIEAVGRVDDLASLAGPDRIGLAPIRVSSGVAIKVADYMGLGMPVIGYPGGLDGFGSELDSASIRVHSTEAFADALVELLTSEEKRRARSEAGLKLAETTLSDSGIVEALAVFRSPSKVATS